MTQRFPRDRFDDVTDGPRVGAHRGARRRGRGWIAFAWAALATGVLVLIGVLVLALLNGSYSFPGSTSSPAPSSSASASAPATGEPSGEATPSPSETQAPTAATPAEQGATSVVVLNGTSTTGLAAKGSTALRNAGWQVRSTGDAGTTGTTATIVYYQQPEQQAVAQGVAKALGIATVEQSAAFPNADVTVVLGADYAG